MDPTRIISIIGRKDSGKTTLLVALAAELTRMGKRVGTIKHGHYSSALDAQGTDTWRHFHEGHARRALLEAPGQRTIFERTEEEGDPEMLARGFMGDMDIVLAEGFSGSSLPRIEVHRSTLSSAPLFDPGSKSAKLWVALVTDDASLRYDFPIFRFTDTAWLVTLSGLAWNRARILKR